MNKGVKVFGLVVVLLIALFGAYALYGALIVGEIDLIFTKIDVSNINMTDMIPDSITGIFSQPDASKVKSYIESKGFELVSAQPLGTSYQVKLRTELITENLLATSLEDAAYLGSYINGADPKIKTLSLDVYYLDDPFYRISGPIEALASAYDTEDESFINLITIEDIRPIEFKIESDLWPFGYLTELSSLDDSSAVFSLIPYQTNVTEMANDLVAMAFIVVQEVPYIDSVTFMIENGDTTEAVTFTTGDILSYTNDEISFEELMNGSGTN